MSRPALSAAAVLPSGRFVGIDPGRDGACCVVGADGLTVLELLEWRRAAEPPPMPVLPGDVVALEAAFVGKNPQSALTLQLWRGRVLAALPAGIVLLEPLATTWRGKVLRRPRMGREQAKEAAMQAAGRYAIGLPASYPDHVAEAWCMARFSWGWAATHKEPT